jgi:cytochrome b6-f complex iron-sulfur subunit
MAEPKKLTTAEILAMARKGQANQPPGQAAAAGSPPGEPAATGSPPASGTPAEDAGQPTPAKSGESPKSTADILAAARAKGAGAPPSAPAGEKPKSTADILAAARAGAASKPAAASGEKPKSTADILAAARAGKAGAAPAKGSDAAAAPATPTAPVVPVASTGDRPPLKEMVAVVKAADAGKPVTAPRLPGSVPPKLPPKKEVSRRSAMQTLVAITVSPFVLAWTAVAAIGGLWGLGMARFMMPNMVLELPSRFKVGPPSDFPPGTVSEKYKASRGVWIVHSDQYDGRDMIYALLSVCTHLGCTPNWLEGEQKFKCPCHGSGYYITGINFEGPAPRPLERVGLRRADDGMLEVDKSIKFQEELGQWGDPKSFMQPS